MKPWLELTGVLLIVGLIFQNYQSRKKRGRWGLNIASAEELAAGKPSLRPNVCPNCHAALPAVRIPHDLYEALWGGNTCQNCGQKIDKWGNKRRR
jgi:hypothetical protein